MKRSGPRGLTVVEVLVIVLGIVVVMALLAGLLMVGVQNGGSDRKARTQTLISGLMMALDHYKMQFGIYPPGGFDANGNGNLTDAGDNRGSGTDPSTWLDQDDPGIEKLQLRSVCWVLNRKDKDGNVIGTSGPFFNPNDIEIKDGAICDAWGEALCYLADGSNPRFDSKTGEPLPGRVERGRPVIWSLGPDREHDDGNDNEDEGASAGAGNGKVDGFDELYDDICSWNLN